MPPAPESLARHRRPPGRGRGRPASRGSGCGPWGRFWPGTPEAPQPGREDLCGAPWRTAPAPRRVTSMAARASFDTKSSTFVTNASRPDSATRPEFRLRALPGGRRGPGTRGARSTPGPFLHSRASGPRRSAPPGRPRGGRGRPRPARSNLVPPPPVRIMPRAQPAQGVRRDGPWGRRGGPSRPTPSRSSPLRSTAGARPRAP